MSAHILNGIHLISFIDLTSLNDNDDETSIRDLCQNAITPYGHVAAVCIYPKFLLLAHELLKNTTIPIATVINFPHPTLSLTETLHETEKALIDGANEIDLVFPYPLYMQGEENAALEYVEKTKKLCQYNKLKVIIETGELQPAFIESISQDVFNAGADFVKTSTGKTKQGATIDAAAIILYTIRDQTSHRKIGLKVSGGIRTIVEAESYFSLASNIMGTAWLHPNVFRIGASQLLNEIITEQTGS